MNRQNTNIRNPFQPIKADKEKIAPPSTATGNIRRINGESPVALSIPSNQSNQKPCSTNIVKRILAGFVEMVAFIDPGSDRSLIRLTAAQSLGNMKPCIPLTLKGFGGGESHSSRSLTLPIVIDKIESTAELYVVADDLLPEDILLGKDILCRPEVRFVIESGDCRIEPSSTTDLTESEEKEFRTIMTDFKQCFADSIAELG